MPPAADELTPRPSAASILLSGVSLVGAPAIPQRQFRCRIASQAPDGALLLEQFTQPRAQPDWLVNYRHEGDGPLTAAVMVRDGAEGPWREAGQVRARPIDLLNGDRGAVAELPLADGEIAPELRVRLQLSAAEARAEARRPGLLSPLARAGSERAGQPRQAEGEGRTEAAEALAAAEAMPALTPQEEVIVKDAWNKLLAFHEMLMEMFFERLLHEAPELIDAFGDAIDNLADDFCGLFDLAVRRLQPHTENVLRESYRNVPGLPKMECDRVEGFAALFADLGMRPRHWLTARKIWVWMLGDIPYLEEYERETLRKGTHGAPYRFFTRHVLRPALEAIRAHDEALPPEVVEEMQRCGDALAVNATAVGLDFYRTLFTQHPEVVPYFARTDMDHLAGHLFKSIAFLTRTLRAGDSALGELRRLAAVHTQFDVPPEAYDALTGPMLEVMRRHYPPFDERLERGWTTLLKRVIHLLAQPVINRRRLLGQARQWLDLIAREQEWPDADKQRRWAEIEHEVRATGIYTHTYEELAYGAQVAWRNAPKCIARISWRNMIVRDLRHVTEPDEMFRECAEHVRMGINGGNMQIVMNVFRPKRPKERWGPRIWNTQYVRYAAYEQPDGTVLGDGANLKLTKAIQRLGWKPPEPRGPFDILPLVIEVPGQPPKLYEFDRRDLLEVPIEHPTVPAFADLGLKWIVIPAIANFRMDIGGIQYGCIPFNGWFMETEIARDLWEAHRYNKAEAIARVLGLDTSSEQTLWRDRAFLELNAAILHSFSKAKVSLVDHQTASRQFLAHDLREKKAGRECPAQWSWVVPAAGGSSTPVWHHEMRDFYLSPHYHYAADKWAVLGEEIAELTEEEGAEAAGGGLLILYGSETGTAEGFARQTARRLQAHRPRVMTLDECDPLSLAQESLVLIVTSTFGEGDLPGNAKRFGKGLKALSRGALSGLNFSVMALGSTVYPHFCAAGALIDQELARLGANRVVALHKGDEIKGQAETFRQWLDLVARLLGEDPTAAAAAPEVRTRVRFVPAPAEPVADGRPGFEARVVANRELLKEVVPGSRSTRFIAFELGGSGLTYETGDHLAVYPRNPAELVERLCARLGVDLDAWFVTELADAAGNAVEGATGHPQPTPVRRALTEDYDLSLREPVQGLVEALAKAAQSPEDRQRLAAWLETLSRGEGAQAAALQKEVIDSYLSVAELLEAFPSCAVSLGTLLELLPRQKPRYYSISSSSLLHPDQVQLTVGVVQVKTAAGKIRQGLCSNYLAGLDPQRGDTARVAVRTSTFRPPKDLRTPVLMVGPGTGLSPLIGFLQHRGAQLRQSRDAGQEARLGLARLYFGCRNRNDYLYEQDLAAWLEQGVLTHLAVAFSRMDERKVYVQHLIAEHGAEIWAVLREPDCHYYVCGDAKMADDVFDALMGVVQVQGGYSRGQAIDFFDRMKAQKRYHADVWGVTLNFQKAIEEVRQAKYAQGERWLQQVVGAAP
jgi:sulfite reductase alpha subunit-like flavoprotein/nitric oxide synthase oxygenase domain/subunit/hemoglobin-like flavoprotein